MGMKIQYDFSLYLNVIRSMFRNFITDDGLLPDFDIRIQSSDNAPSHSEPVNQIGDYLFYKNDDGFLFSFGGILLHLSDDLATANVYCPNDMLPTKQSDIGYLLMMAYRYRLISLNGIIIHSAAVVHNSSCICFCGVSGAGKSTQVDLWQKHLKAWPINFDQPCILDNNGKYIVHGSPWSGKEHLFRNCYAPLKAIVFVEQSANNSAELLSKGEAFSLLYLNNYVFPLSTELEKKYADNIKKIAENTPVYRLNCTISEDAVEALYSKLFANDYKSARKVSAMTYTRKSSFEMKEIAGDFILIPRGSDAVNYSAVLVLNETGAFLWKHLEKALTVNELADLLVQEFSPDAETAYTDVVKFLDKMLENNLLDTAEN